MQIKQIMRHHFSLSTLAQIKIGDNVAQEGWRIKSIHILSMRVEVGKSS